MPTGRARPKTLLVHGKIWTNYFWSGGFPICPGKMALGSFEQKLPPAAPGAICPEGRFRAK
jgi:hypothetical protein